MAAPNIVNVATITGVTTYHAGIAITTGGRGELGITTIVSNPASSGRVIKVNSLVACGIANTTGLTLQYFDDVSHVGAASTVSIAMTAQVPVFSSLVVISKENSIYLEENSCLGAFAEPSKGRLDIICSFEEIS
jgi:hypothetical protein